MVKEDKKCFISTKVNHSIWYDKFNYSFDMPMQYDYENVLLKCVVHQPIGNVEEIYGDTSIIGT